MANAQGFASVFNDVASISLAATPFGNYYPAKILITWTGWLNPVGPAYADFRGGIVLSADGKQSGASLGIPYMTAWGRDGQSIDVTPWSQSGFVLSLRSGSQGADGS